MVKYYDPRQKIYLEEAAYGNQLLEKLYGSVGGRLLLAWIVRPWFSKSYSLWDYTRFSRSKVQSFIDRYGINLSCYQEQHFANFAQFFTRRMKKEWIRSWEIREIGAIAQAKLQVLQIDETSQLRIKQQDYQLEALLQDTSLADYYRGGTACLYRLGMEDYHRFLVAESGRIGQQRNIQGALHSVRGIAQMYYPVFKENVRTYTVIETLIGKVTQVEVGALLVGKIHQHFVIGDQLEAGWEKGYFGLGGSSILVLYPKDTVRIDATIQELSNKGFECQVQIGQRIGEKVC